MSSHGWEHDTLSSSVSRQNQNTRDTVCTHIRADCKRWKSLLNIMNMNVSPYTLTPEQWLQLTDTQSSLKHSC